MNTNPQFEQQVQIIASQFHMFPADVRVMLMDQLKLSPEQYASLNPEIRSTSLDGKGFFGQPG